MDYFINRANKFLNSVGGVLAVLLGAYIFLDVLGRNFFNFPMIGAYELAQNGVVLLVFLSLPTAIEDDSILRIGGFYEQTSPFNRRIIYAFGLLIGIVFFVGIAYANFDFTIHAFKMHEVDGQATIRLPMGPVRAVLLVLWFWAAWVLIYQFWKLIFKLNSILDSNEEI